jgi:putative membrane protein
MFAKILFSLYLILFITLAINPFERAVWWAENAPVWITVISIILLHLYYHPFSNLALSIMAIFIALHTIGGHYTFERVPFEFISDFFGFQRNHYDRIAHFSIGLYAFAMAEILYVKKLTSSNFILLSYPLFAIFAIASLYEIFEWQYALSADESAGIAVLGSQGDIWDAQKDMFSDGLGAIVGMVIFYLTYKFNDKV